MLSDLKILDFTSLLPGPYATMVLGDMGAEVIRVENPNREDLVNVLQPAIGTKSAVFTYINRNKKFIELDLQTKEGRSKIYELLKNYDIIVEGFRPGTMKRMGLDYHSLKEYNPKIIYLSLTGYGQNGPLKNRAGHDINYLALSGIASIIGTSQTGPILPGLQLADLTGSFYTVIALLSAYIHRLKTGQGQYIDVAMRDCSMSLAPLQYPRQLLDKDTPNYSDHILGGASYYNYYKTEDENYLAIGGLEPKFFKKLCDVLDLKADMKTRLFNEKLISKIKEIIKTRTLDYWINEFKDIDACVEPVLGFDEVITLPQTKTRNMIVPVKIKDISRKQVAHPIKYSKYEPMYEYYGDN